MTRRPGIDSYWNVVHVQVLLWRVKTTKEASSITSDLHEAEVMTQRGLSDRRAKVVLVSIHNEWAKLFVGKLDFRDTCRTCSLTQLVRDQHRESIRAHYQSSVRAQTRRLAWYLLLHFMSMTVST